MLLSVKDNIKKAKGGLSGSAKNQWQVISRLIGGAVAVLVSVLFFFASKVVIGFVEFISVPFNNRKKRSFLNRHPLSVLWIIGGVFIFVQLKGRATILQNFPNTQILVWLVEICLAAILYIVARIALDVPGSTNEIIDELGDLKRYNWFARRLMDPADMIWVKTIVVLTILIIPPFVGILLPNSFSFCTAVIYGIAWWAGSSALSMLEHTNSHQHIFRARKNWSKRDRLMFKAFDIYTGFILVFMFARIPKWYEVQHIFVHHQEDNSESDTQSTLIYDRSSFIDFARCANRFALSGLFSHDIINYLKNNNKHKPLAELFAGMAIFYASLGVLCLWNWHFVVTILAFRYCSQIMATFGFFHEHGMVDIIEPRNVYRNSIHFITDANSHASLGDDAHIEHHLHMGRHWTRYANDVNNNLEAYSSEGALGYLDGPGGVREYYRLLWRRDYTKLAQNFIVFGNEPISTERIAHLLWERTRPVNYTSRPIILDRVDHFLGRAAGFLLV